MKIGKWFVVVFYLASISCSDFEFVNHEENSKNESTFDVSKKHMNPSELVKWINDPENGFIRVQQIENITYSLLFKPLDYMVCIEERKDTIPESTIRKKRNELSDLEFFELKISVKKYSNELLKYDLASEAEYNSRVDYCAFKMQDDIFMVVDNDTIPCSIFHFERAYDAMPYAKFLFAFNKNSDFKMKEKTLIFDDHLFKKGFIKFRFSKNVFSSSPSLTLL